MKFILSLAALAAAPSAYARCATPSSLPAVEALLSAGDKHYDELEDAALRQDLDDAAGAITCLEVALPATTAAHLHRLTGLWHDLQGDAASRDASFTAAVRADPEYRFPARVLAPDNPTARAYVATIGATVAVEPVPEPAADVRLLWDGAAAPGRPGGLPVVLQVIEGEDVVSVSRLLAASDPLPDYRVPVAVAVGPDPDPDPQGWTRGRVIKVSLLGGGGLMLAGSAAASYLAWDKVQRFEANYYGAEARTVGLESADDDAWTTAEGDTQRALTLYRAYTGGAVGLGALGAGAITAALVVEW